MIYGLLSGFKVLDWDEPVAKVVTEVMGTQIEGLKLNQPRVNCECAAHMAGNLFPFDKISS